MRALVVANAIGEFGLAQRAYLALCAVWLLLAAPAVLRDGRIETRTPGRSEIRSR